jgi:hypothetical protein
MPLAPILPYRSPPPVALVCVANPLKTLSFCAKNVCLFVLAGTLLQFLRRPQDLRPPFDAGQVPSLPPNNPTMHFLPHVSLFPSQAHQPGLEFLEVFFGRAGTSAQKGASHPSPHLLFCFSSGLYPPQPPCTSYAPFCLSFPSQNCCLHPNPSIFSFALLALQLFFLGVLGVPEPPLDVLEVCLAPLCPSYFAFFPNLFYFFWTANGLDSTFWPFLGYIWLLF